MNAAKSIFLTFNIVILLYYVFSLIIDYIILKLSYYEIIRNQRNSTNIGEC
ncbi:hypothetical protein SAMN06265346_10451 [Flavobacterium hercynium]|nr:hypothetical protein SAMN06265346_10451 [Flavobacterium hercynium]